jgi:hypothetical protein
MARAVRDDMANGCMLATIRDENPFGKCQFSSAWI